MNAIHALNLLFLIGITVLVGRQHPTILEVTDNSQRIHDHYSELRREASHNKARITGLERQLTACTNIISKTEIKYVIRCPYTTKYSLSEVQQFDQGYSYLDAETKTVLSFYNTDKTKKCTVEEYQGLIKE